MNKKTPRMQCYPTKQIIIVQLIGCLPRGRHQYRAKCRLGHGRMQLSPRFRLHNPADICAPGCNHMHSSRAMAAGISLTVIPTYRHWIFLYGGLTETLTPYFLLFFPIVKTTFGRAACHTVTDSTPVVWREARVVAMVYVECYEDELKNWLFLSPVATSLSHIEAAFSFMISDPHSDKRIRPCS